MNKNSFKDAAFLATAALLMGGLASANALPGLASTVRLPQPIPNLPSIDQAFNVIGRDNI